MCKVQFNQSDVIVMVETWLNKNDAVNFDKFNVIANIASEEFHTLGSKNEVRRRRAFGILCLQRQSSRDNVTVPCKFISSSVETIPNGIVPSKMQLVHLELQWSFANDMTSDKNIIALYVVYIPVQAKRAQILSFLRKNVNFKENLMFVGDINVSFVDNSSIKICLQTVTCQICFTTTTRIPFILPRGIIPILIGVLQITALKTNYTLWSVQTYSVTIDQLL